jgi:hypothetical protein
MGMVFHSDLLCPVEMSNANFCLFHRRDPMVVGFQMEISMLL